MKHRIWLDQPAKRWDTGLPLGNGRLGAMIAGQVAEEVISLNEETIWYGPEQKRTNPDSKAYLPEIRRLLLKGETEKAQYLGKLAMTSGPKYLTPYLPAGDLRISFYQHRGEVSHYRRELDLDDAVASVSYQMGGYTFRREYLISEPHRVLAIRLTTDAPQGLTFAANLNRRPYEEHTGKLGQDAMSIWGQCGADGIRYCGVLKAAVSGGSVTTVGDYVSVSGAKEAYLYVAYSTDFLGNAGYREEAERFVTAAAKEGFDAVLQKHLELYHRLFQRVSLQVNADQTPEEPTDVLLDNLRREENSDYLAVLLFYFGRYLMIASSYHCQLPSNLQGIWNGSYTPSWESKYTININTEMNYWPAETGNLSECHLPLFDLVERMLPNGRKTAQEVYGCRGFVAHHNTNLWGNTDTEGIFDASPIWPMGGAWLSLHFYEHFLFTQDLDFLRSRALPILEENVQFFSDYLTDDGEGHLLTGPSISPENTYISPAGERGALCMSPTMDNQIVRQVLRSYLEGCRLLGKETALCTRAEEILEKLPKTRIGSDGRILEWYQEYQETEPGHRHVSHLYGLFPGYEITEEQPELFAAAEKTLDQRLSNGGGHTGWSRAWIINFFARLKKGEKAHFHLMELLRRSTTDSMLDSHPPFQIDGNFGAVSGITEMLVQSHNHGIDLLPALPAFWKQGSLKGVCLRGAVTAAISWEDGVLSQAVLTSKLDQTLTVRYQGKEQQVVCPAGKPVTIVF